MQRHSIRKALYLVATLALAFALIGCKGPSKANIELRKKNQELTAKVERLERQQTGHLAQLRALEAKSTTAPFLPQDQLSRLFTVHGLSFGRLTGADKDGVKVYVIPTDDAGEELKAAGSFVVEAFDLARKDRPLVARCEFDIDQSRKAWVGQALIHAYVLTCKWQSAPPQHPDITLKVTFTDALTGRSFTGQKLVKLSTPPTSR